MPVDTPRVNVVAQPIAQALPTPAPNAALQLADSLSDLEPTLRATVGDVMEKQRRVLGAKAHQDALQTAGLGFAEAVRQGKIEPTQNPFYIQAYERNAAQVSGQQQVSAIVADSQSWAERNDPKAYSAKLAQTVGEAGKGYTSPDAQIGYAAAAAPLMEQAQNSNLQYNVQRIQSDHIQNATTLNTQAIQDTIKATPAATPDQIFANLEPQHQQWIGVGGTESDWRLLVKQSVVNAASNTDNPDLVDILRAPYRGGAPIANQADKEGKPIGLELDSDKYWITRSAESAGQASIRAHTIELTQQANAAKDALWAAHGTDILSGKVPQEQIVKELTAQGFKPEAIAKTIDLVGQEVVGSDTYSRSILTMRLGTPTASAEVLALRAAGMHSGLTAGYEAQVKAGVLRGVIDEATASSMLSEAQATTNRNIQEARADQREARAEASSARAIARQDPTNMSVVSHLKAATENAIEATFAQLEVEGIHTSPQERKRASQVFRDQGATVLFANPADGDNALRAVGAAAAGYLRWRRSGHTGELRAGSSSGASIAAGAK